MEAKDKSTPKCVPPLQITTYSLALPSPTPHNVLHVFPNNHFPVASLLANKMELLVLRKAQLACCSRMMPEGIAILQSC